MRTVELPRSARRRERKARRTSGENSSSRGTRARPRPGALRRWVSFLALCGVLEQAVESGVIETYYLKGGVAMELRFARAAGHLSCFPQLLHRAESPTILG
jgi:hypothetical protein